MLETDIPIARDIRFGRMMAWHLAPTTPVLSQASGRQLPGLPPALLPIAICPAICLGIGRSVGNDMMGISDMGLGFAIAVAHSFPGRSD